MQVQQPGETDTWRITERERERERTDPYMMESEPVSNWVLREADLRQAIALVTKQKRTARTQLPQQPQKSVNAVQSCTRQIPHSTGQPYTVTPSFAEHTNGTCTNSHEVEALPHMNDCKVEKTDEQIVGCEEDVEVLPSNLV
jgi:hypothetical protein